MAMRKAILLDDPISSNGSVVTATSKLPNIGRMIATVGDMAYCKTCHTKAPIIPLNEVACMMPNGKQIALEGDMVDCRCAKKPTLIATDSTVTVEDNRVHHTDWPASVGQIPRQVAAEFDDHYKLIDEETKKPLKHADYAIERADGSIEEGTTDAEGRTHMLSQTAVMKKIKI